MNIHFTICAAILLLFAYSEAALNKEEKQKLLNAHNYLRSHLSLHGDSSQPGASDMMLMSWSDESAVKAQQWADRCISGHDLNTDREYGNYDWVGQNWAANTIKPVIYEGVERWYNEIKDYTYSNNKQCRAVCGHYTQIVWSKSTELGCGVADCSSRGGYKYNLVCNYAPAGNYNGQYPYLNGTSCSQCPQGFSQCKRGLCTSASPGVSRSGISNSIVPQSWSEVDTANIGNVQEEVITTRSDPQIDTEKITSTSESESTTKPTLTCTNRKSDKKCNRRAKKGRCESQKHSRWMKKNCRKSCNFC